MFGTLPGAQASSRPSTLPASAPLSVADICNRDFTGSNLNLLPSADVLLMKGVFSLQVLHDMCARTPGFPKSENLSRVMLVKHVEAFRQIFDCAATEGSHRQPAAPALAVPQHNFAGAEGPAPPAIGDVPSRFVFREGSEPQASPSPIAAGAAVADATSLPTRPVLQPRGQFPSPPSSTATPGVGAPPAPSPAVDPRLAFFAGVHAPVSQPSVLQQPVQAFNADDDDVAITKTLLSPTVAASFGQPGASSREPTTASDLYSLASLIERELAGGTRDAKLPENHIALFAHQQIKVTVSECEKDDAHESELQLFIKNQSKKASLAGSSRQNNKPTAPADPNNAKCPKCQGSHSLRDCKSPYALNKDGSINSSWVDKRNKHDNKNDQGQVPLLPPPPARG
ncbi:hypothetical protein CYMTET_42875 [Cymbomonas tetramitiformis]|uniref:Uncharacterized protein n=1 Tax=Cymbomonas tetramitiformis TaxID=36881 RepID=A0AAE0C5E2_9CHLO|nr:hypothetical protein CYMTET_42875 [Cymbomonas tetramitiformis]